MENKALVLDLVEWIAQEPRAYEEAMDAWKTSCPRLTVWEDAVDAGYLKVSFAGEHERQVEMTTSGEEFLRRNGRYSGSDAQ